MSKRSANTLTGGSGDVNPQILTISENTSAANTFTQLQVPVPVQRYAAGRDRALVMEMLKIFFYLPEPDANPAAGGSVLQAWNQITTRSVTGITEGTAASIAVGSKVVRGAFTAAGTYGTYSSDPNIVDLTDGAGHGVLVATDNIFMGINTANFTGTATFSCKILYRFKEVGITEYIGIVQSQQAA